MGEKEQHFLKVIEANQSKIGRICGVYAANDEDKKDMVQEVLLNIWKSWPSFKNAAKVDTWIYRIALNVCMRAKYLNEKKKFRPIESIRFEPMAAHEEVENELWEKLHLCIGKLEEGEKAIVILFLEDLPYKEIAEIIGISENYVAVKIRRIKSKLNKCIKS